MINPFRLTYFISCVTHSCLSNDALRRLKSNPISELYSSCYHFSSRRETSCHHATHTKILFSLWSIASTYISLALSKIERSSSCVHSSIFINPLRNQLYPFTWLLLAHRSLAKPHVSACSLLRTYPKELSFTVFRNFSIFWKLLALLGNHIGTVCIVTRAHIYCSLKSRVWCRLFSLLSYYD